MTTLGGFVRYPRLAWSLAALAIVATACTNTTGSVDPVPTASPSTLATSSPLRPSGTAPSVAVVLPARQARSIQEIDRERVAVHAIADNAIANRIISSIRTVVPDRITTVGDVLEAMAEEGHDLVCALGPGAARAIRDVAPRFPGTLFCGTPGDLPDVPPNALVFDLRVEESAYLAGIAAAEAAAFVGSDDGSRPAMIVADSGQASRLREAFDQGYSVSRALVEPTVVRVARTQSLAFDTAESLYGAGVYLVYGSAGRVEQGVVEAAKARGRLFIGTFADLATQERDEGASPSPSPSTDPPADAWNLMLLGENLSAAFRDTIDELASGWRGGARSLGFQNGALTLTPGTSPIWERIAPQVLRTRDSLVAGTELQVAGD
ncbi:MAG: basic membrane lipoprotein Med (substrate-binding protein (PBP1-ABC) superfamily) [Glaciecola sp.]|jgi:basic membrane lipoprotein Med (substrate-binding protein (PBP1-ABC) superfamily)